MFMKRRSFLGSSVALLAGRMLGSGDTQEDQTPLRRAHAASLMTECANRFLVALDANQRGKASFPFDTDERMNWHFVPKERKGLPLREMTPYQKHLASALLAAGLSQTGYIKAVTIMSLEDVLKIMENDSGERRNPDKYYVSVFGSPSDGGTWGYRVEGHHLSQNYTVVHGTVVDGPSFFGANPAEGGTSRPAIRPLRFQDERQAVRRAYGSRGGIRSQRAGRTRGAPDGTGQQRQPEHLLRVVGRHQPR
jgi:hypothetical protein